MSTRQAAGPSAGSRDRPAASPDRGAVVKPEQQQATKNLWLPVPGVNLSSLPDLLTLLKHGNNLCRPENETGSGVRVHVNDIQVALFRFGVRVFAINATCPHAGGPLELGDIEDLAVGEPCVVCPFHKYRFRILTGRNSIPGQPQFNVETYPVKVKNNGKLFIGFAKLPDHVFGDEDF